MLRCACSAAADFFASRSGGSPAAGAIPILTTGLRLAVGSIVALMGLTAFAQTPSVIFLMELDGYAQTSATQTEYRTGGFGVEVDFSSIPPAATKVTLKKPNGSTVAIPLAEDGAYYYEEYFSTSAQLKAAYPNGTYQISVTNGGSDNTTSIAATFTPIPVSRITNFDQLQSIDGASATVSWNAVPKTGDLETLYWELLDTHGNQLNSVLLSDARLTSTIFDDIPGGTSLFGAIAYLGYAVSSANNGSTGLAVGTGFTLVFPMFRIASAPAAPKSVGAYGSGYGQMTITWQAPIDTDLTGYTLERSTSSDFPQSNTTRISLPGAYTSYIDDVGTTPAIYYYRVTATNPYGSSAPTAAAQAQTLGPTGNGATRLANIATRARCGVGDNVTIGGFVVTGAQKKRVLIRAVGPTLESQGISASDLLRDPVMSVYRGQTVIATNDDWGTNPNAAEIKTVGAQIGANPLSLNDTASSALLIDLDPGAYTFVVNGKNGASGIVLLEVYDAALTGESRFANIATRANSTGGAGVTIGGFVITGDAPRQVLLRAIGPTLATYGLNPSAVLADPVIELHRGAPVIATNNNWTTNLNKDSILTTSARIGAASIADGDNKSSVLLITLPPGVYSFLAYDKNNSDGIVLVEAYDAGP